MVRVTAIAAGGPPQPRVAYRESTMGRHLMMFRAGVAALFLLGLCGASAMSASPKCNPGPSQADIDACTPDVHAQCGQFIPDEAAITRCLTAKKAVLSVACRKVMSRPYNRNLPRCERKAGNN
jgi:hypothetical protein